MGAGNKQDEFRNKKNAEYLEVVLHSRGEVTGEIDVETSFLDLRLCVLHFTVVLFKQVLFARCRSPPVALVLAVKRPRVDKLFPKVRLGQLVGHVVLVGALDGRVLHENRLDDGRSKRVDPLRRRRVDSMHLVQGRRDSLFLCLLGQIPVDDVLHKGKRRPLH